MSALTPESLPCLECFPAKGMDNYALWCSIIFEPEPTEPDPEDLITW
jgi:hypothetical protein